MSVVSNGTATAERFDAPTSRPLRKPEVFDRGDLRVAALVLGVGDDGCHDGGAFANDPSRVGNGGGTSRR
jgi:hypothetical protein